MTPSHAISILDHARLNPPKILTLAITGICNLFCAHCWVDAGARSSAPHVPTHTVMRLIEEFAAMGGDGIRITGGEPLCHPEWLNLLRYARTTGFRRVMLQTNGILLTDAHVQALRELDFPGLSIQISLDGAKAPTHDLVRGTGTFAGALSAIRRLAEAGLAPRIAIAFTEMRHNLEEVPALLKLAADLGVGSVITGTLVTGGRADRNSRCTPPRPEQYLRLLDRYDADMQFRRNYDSLGTMAALEWRREDTRREQCCTFAENPYLTPDGRLYPCLLCHTDAYAVTGVFEKGLAAAFAEGAPLWTSLLRVSRRRADAIAACRECPAKTACKGGCMGRAWGSCGDLLATDDRCEVRQAIHRAA